MRNISFSMTTAQFIDGSKDVTRRFGWWFLKSGDRLMAVEKAMGLKKGEKIVRLGEIEVISVRREPLSEMSRDLEYGLEELRREGYPFGCTSPTEFVIRLAKKQNVSRHEFVNRIEFKKINYEDKP